MKIAIKTGIGSRATFPNINFFSLATLFFFISCTSLRPVNIEVSKNAKYPLPDRIQGIAIINRSMTPIFTNSKADSLENMFYYQQWVLDSIFHDKQSSDKTIESAATALFGSERYDVVIPLDRNIVRTDTQSIDLPLDRETFENYCVDFKVDAILVLENFNEHLTASFSRIPQTDLPNIKKRKMKVVCNSVWNLYFPDKDLKIKTFNISDSLEWKAESIYMPDVRYKLPNLKKSLVLAAEACGNKMSATISPEWIQKPRHYFATGKSQIDKAIPLIQNNNWDEAAKIWSHYTNSTSKTVRGKIEFNMALVCEMFGKIDLATEWCMKSYQTKYMKVKEDYLNILDQRKKEIDSAKGKSIF